MDSLRSLRKWNLAAAGAHTVLLIGLAVAFRNKPKEDRTIGMYRGSIPVDILSNVASYPGYDSCSKVDFPLKPKQTAKHDPMNWLYLFLGITVVAHLFYAWNPNQWYSNAVLGKGWNPFRWIEYGVSAGIMAYLVSMLDGEKNQNAAILIAAATTALNLQGLIVENSMNQNARALHYERNPFRMGPAVDPVPIVTATVCGWLLLAVSWYAILGSFFGLLDDIKQANPPANKPKPKLPGFLYGVGFSQLLFFIQFGNVQLRQVLELWREKKALARGDRVTVKPYISYEKNYIWLSFAAKATLAGFIGYGLMRRGGVSC